MNRLDESGTDRTDLKLAFPVVARKRCADMLDKEDDVRPVEVVRNRVPEKYLLRDERVYD